MAEISNASRYGKTSPLLVCCIDVVDSNGNDFTGNAIQQTQIYPKLSDFPFYQAGDIELLEEFFTILKPLDTEKNARLIALDSYFDIPTIEAVLTPSYEAIRRCIENDCIIFMNLLHQPDINNIFRHAAYNGHLEVLKWLRANDCLWNITSLNYAARGGHLKILKWAHANGCEWDKWTCVNAAAYGYIDVLQWLRSNNCPWNEKISEISTYYGRLDVLKWLYENGHPVNRNISAVAAQRGYLEILKWIENKNIVTYSIHEVSHSAARNGHLEILKWLKDNNKCSLTLFTCAAAAGGGQLEILKWLRANGCPWDRSTLDYSAWNGHFKVLEWARANGCPKY